MVGPLRVSHTKNNCFNFPSAIPKWLNTAKTSWIAMVRDWVRCVLFVERKLFTRYGINYSCLSAFSWTVTIKRDNECRSWSKNCHNSIVERTQFCMHHVSMRTLAFSRWYSHQTTLYFLMNWIMHRSLMEFVCVKQRSNAIGTEIWRVSGTEEAFIKSISSS